MAQRHEEKKQETNGYAHESGMQNALKGLQSHPVLEGYAFLALGTITALFGLGYFPLLSWVIFAAGVVLAFLGARKAGLIEMAGHLIERIRKYFHK